MISSSIGAPNSRGLFEVRRLFRIFCSSTRRLNEIDVYLKGTYNQGNMVVIIQETYKHIKSI